MSKTFPAFKEFEKVVFKIWPQKSNFLLGETVGVLILYPYLAKICKSYAIPLCCHALAFRDIYVTKMN